MIFTIEPGPVPGGRARIVTASHPTRVMVVGASADRGKYGNKAVRAFVAQGFEVFAVTPRGAEARGSIEGVPTVGRIADVPGPVDRAAMYLPPPRMLAALDEIAARGDVAEVWLNPGTDSPEVVAHAKSLGLVTIRACSIMAVGPMPD